ncbi:hypothetical protein [Arthrobacter monumenti]
MAKRKQYVPVGASALAGGAIIGVSAGLFEPVNDFAWLAGLAFGTLGFLAAGLVAWVVLVAGKDPKIVRTENANSIEQSWIRRAASSAFFDLIVLLSLVVLFFSITRFEAPLQFVLAPVVFMALADMGIRRAILAKRES